MGARRRHTPEQIIRKLREGEKLIGQGLSLVEVCKQLEECGADDVADVAGAGGGVA
jgi:putative transposase